MSGPTQKSLFAAPSEEPTAWELAADADVLTAQVAINRPMDTTFYYRVPDALRAVIQPGQRVNVPFGRGDRPTVGYCVGLGAPPSTSRTLKSVLAVLDERPLLTAPMLELTRWIADRYLCAWGQVLDCVVPAGVRKQAGTKAVAYFQPADDANARLAQAKLPPKQQAVMDALCAAQRPLTLDELMRAAGCGAGTIHALRGKGLVQSDRQRVDNFAAAVGQPEPETDLTLNPAQRTALDTILSQLRSGEHATCLLHGVTGSGKTEVYIQAIREVVSYGRQAIVLVPEISLTPQTIRRFRSRFAAVAVLHSHLSDAERHWHWQQIAAGRVQVVVGARSAVFAPTPHLGLIVIDEEHETTFKQETAPRYHAREVARERARMEQVPLILGSATPTLESWHRVLESQDTLLSLPDRAGQRPLPPVSIVDIRNDPRCANGGAAIGRALHSAIQTALDDGGQAILFLNLRGFSPTVWCRACGEGVKCPNCDITLTFHRDRKIVLCHFCEYETAPPPACPRCQQPGLRYLGTGTQRLEHEVRARFPSATCVRMDSDSMRRPGSHDQALEAFRTGKVQILLGTQMIAKGLDFPNVTLVGVVDADTLLHQPDLRAAERTFQLIAQVAGRTGRSARGGRVLVQTTCPTEPAILLAAKHDFLSFAQHELKHRQEMLAPPFQHQARVILRGPDEQEVQQEARSMADLLRETCRSQSFGVRILGPAPAPIAKQRKQYRFHFRLTADSLPPIQALWHAVAEKLPHSNRVEFVVDVDPLDMR